MEKKDIVVKMNNIRKCVSMKESEGKSQMTYWQRNKLTLKML